MKYIIYDKISAVDEYTDKLKAFERAKYWSTRYQNDFKISDEDGKLIGIFAKNELIYCDDSEMRNHYWYKGQ